MKEVREQRLAILVSNTLYLNGEPHKLKELRETGKLMIPTKKKNKQEERRTVTVHQKKIQKILKS